MSQVVPSSWIQRLTASGMLIYIYSTNKYKRSVFLVEMMQSIFVIVSNENAKKSCLSLNSKSFLFEDD